ncbi:MAG: GNAT family N-acetyltransferase [Thermomicrobiales bacterium]
MNRTAGEAVRLREVEAGDLPTFFEHQLDLEATEMAAFPSRDRKTFMRSWERLLNDDEVIARTILYENMVAGNIVSAIYTGKREVGYWLGREFWGRGIATQGLAAFLHQMTIRPVYAHVATHNIGSIRVLEKNGFEVVREQRNLLFMKLAGAS